MQTSFNEVAAAVDVFAIVVSTGHPPHRHRMRYTLFFSFFCRRVRCASSLTRTLTPKILIDRVHVTFIIFAVAEIRLSQKGHCRGGRAVRRFSVGGALVVPAVHTGPTHALYVSDGPKVTELGEQEVRKSTIEGFKSSRT